MTIYNILLVYIFAFIYDFANVRYIKAVNELSKWVASVWSVIVYGIGLVGLYCVLRVSLWLSVPEAVGLASGTYASLWLRQRNITLTQAGGFLWRFIVR